MNVLDVGVAVRLPLGQPVERDYPPASISCTVVYCSFLVCSCEARPSTKIQASFAFVRPLFAGPPRYARRSTSASETCRRRPRSPSPAGRLKSISQPAVDVRFDPSNSPQGKTDRRREQIRAIHSPNRGVGKANSFEHGRSAQDSSRRDCGGRFCLLRLHVIEDGLAQADASR